MYELAQEIRPALTRLYVMYFRVSEQSSLTAPQLSLMTRLKNVGEARISQLAKDEGIRMPTASNALHQLEQRGLIERVRDSSDRRGVRVQLNEEGREELKRVGQERDEQMARMFKRLSAEDRARCQGLSDVLERLADSYEELLQQRTTPR